ncbi:MAG: permease prefix domain 1-containing protein [Bryobacteraceae bacterium]
MKRLVAFIRGRRIDRELTGEVEAHIAERVDDLVEAGTGEHEARQQALREFGNATRYVEISRGTWGWTWLDAMMRDMRYGLRMMRRTPAFTAAALVSLTLGIGATCAIFSVLHALLLTQLPFRAPENLVEIHQTHPRLPKGYVLGTSLPDLADWK